MSKDNRELPSSEEAAREYIEWLVTATSPYIKVVYLGGSRSPKSKNPPRQYSDWDFYAVFTRKVVIASARSTGKLHGDVVLITQEMAQHRPPQCVEIWPNDTVGFFGQPTQKGEEHEQNIHPVHD